MSDKNEALEQSEVEFDIDTENPRKVVIIISSSDRDMDGRDIYDALHCYVHDILGPEVLKDAKDCKDIKLQ